jgi:hypothetical protein
MCFLFPLKNKKRRPTLIVRGGKIKAESYKIKAKGVIK